MDLWEHNRGSVEDPRFAEVLASLGISSTDWDWVASSISDVLNGVTDDALDEHFPEMTSGGLRIILTQSTRNVPPLRVAFTVEKDNNGTVCYKSVDFR
jgi:hypothetical protein